MILIFSKHINHWLDRLPQISGTEMAHDTFVQDTMHHCKLLALRLIALTMYREAFDETVRPPFRSFLLTIRRLFRGLMLSENCTELLQAARAE